MELVESFGDFSVTDLLYVEIQVFKTRYFFIEEVKISKIQLTSDEFVFCGVGVDCLATFQREICCVVLKVVYPR